MQHIIDDVFLNKDKAMLFIIASSILVIFLLKGASLFGQNYIMESGQRFEDVALFAENRTQIVDAAQAEKYGCADEQNRKGSDFECKITGRKILETYLNELAESGGHKVCRT